MARLLSGHSKGGAVRRAGVASAMVGAAATVHRWIGADPETVSQSEAESPSREQGRLLRAAIDRMPTGVVIYDRTLRLAHCNAPFLQLYKLPETLADLAVPLTEVIRMCFERAGLVGDPTVYVRKALDDIAAARNTSKIIDWPDGRIISVESRVLEGGGRLSVHEDVTARRRDEAMLRTQSQQLDIALNNITQGLVMFDSDTRVVLANQRYADLYDLPPHATAPGSTLLDVMQLRYDGGLLKVEPQVVVEKILTSLRTGVEGNFINAGSGGRTIRAHNRPLPDGGWVTTHEDITETVAAEKALREQTRKLDIALNNMRQGLTMFDPEGRLTLWNRRYIEIYGLDPETISAGLSFAEVLRLRAKAQSFSRDDIDGYAATLIAQMQRGERFNDISALPGDRFIAIGNEPLPQGGWVSTHEDISEQRRIERERDRSQALAATVIESVPATIMVREIATQRYVLINSAAENYCSRPRAGMIGRTPAEVFPPEVAAIIRRTDEQTIATGGPVVVDDHPSVMKGRESRIITTMRVPIKGPDGTPQFMLTVINDRTQRKRTEAQIAHLTYHDTLTGLPNRAAFDACLAETAERCRSENASIALMAINVDRFKDVNDLFGRQTGDALLRAVAERIQSVIGGAFVARLDGDEFVIVDVDHADPVEAQAFAERMIEAMTTELTVEGRPIRVGISLGIALYPANGTTPQVLTTNADAALARAKADGGGVARFFAPETDERLKVRRLLMQDLRAEIDGDCGQIVLHYQPQARIDGTIIGFEALARWSHPKRGPVSPGEFIPLAEESGLIVPLGARILRQACREAAGWRIPLGIAVNLSPVQFTQQADLPALVHAVLLETGLAPARLELEITEGVMIEDRARALAILRRLKGLGVRIAMDDFGTGYSSLSYLQSFPFDKIKIDQSFMANLETRPQTKAILRAALGLANGLGVPVLAEGVETQAQLDFLATEGCDEVQGYLIGRPQPAEAYAALTGNPAPAMPAMHRS